MSPHRLAVRLGLLPVTCAALIVPGAAAVAGAAPHVTAAAPAHKGTLPPKNPSRNARPKPFFLISRSCAGGRDGAACNRLVLRGTTRARALLEKMGGMSFSLSAYDKLTPIEQLFATVNLERTKRGLPPAVVLTKSLDKVAQAGANSDRDPQLGRVPRTLPGGGTVVGLGSNWAGGWDNALGANYAWMYDDGLGSDNGACSKNHPAGCWGHRDNILGTFSKPAWCGGLRSVLAMGAGHVTRAKAYGDSETELLAGVCGRTPTDVVMTWAKAKRLLHVK